MNDPKRLLEVDYGRTRELLEVGLSDVAPARTRANVLSSVSSVVASLELGAVGARSQSGLDAGTPEALVGHAGTAPTGLSTATASSALAKLVVVVQAANALKLSAVVASVGFGGLLYHHVQHEAAPADTQHAAAPSPAPTPAHVAAPARGPRATEPDVVVAEPPSPTSHAPRPSASSTPRVTAPNKEPPTQATAEVERTDDLGAELELIARARAQLAAREPHIALLLLTEFTQRFPHGALVPEAQLLEQRARAQLDVPAP